MRFLPIRLNAKSLKTDTLSHPDQGGGTVGTVARWLWLPKISSGLAAGATIGYLRVGMIDLLKLLGGWLVGLFMSHAAREAEVAFLRQQLLVLKRSAPSRLRLRTADRLIFVWLSRLFPSLLEAAVIFKPETLVRWHRSGVRLYWRWTSRRRVGRPAVPADIDERRVRPAAAPG